MFRLAGGLVFVTVLALLSGGGVYDKSAPETEPLIISAPDGRPLLRFEAQGDVHVVFGSLEPDAAEMVPNPFELYDDATSYRFVCNGEVVGLVSYDTGTLYLRGGTIGQEWPGELPANGYAAFVAIDDEGTPVAEINAHGILLHGMLFVHGVPYSPHAAEYEPPPPPPPSKSAASTKAADDPVDIPDSSLEAAIRAELGIPEPDPITEADMLDLTYLNAGHSDPPISDLTGLEYAENLQKLYLYGNNIADLSPIAGLPALRILWLWENAIRDIDPLAAVYTLEDLMMHSNEIGLDQNGDIDPNALVPLAGLTNLTRLALGRNQLTDTDQNSVLDPIAALTNIERLYVYDNAIADLSPLTSMTKLEHVGFFDNLVPDLSAFEDLVAQKRQSNPDYVPPLTIMQAHRNMISDLGPLSEYVNLRELLINENNLSGQPMSLQPLAPLTSLQQLWCGWNDIHDVSPLSAMTAMDYLSISVNEVDDISPLAAMAQMTRLFANSNQISDISVVADMPLLEQAWFGSNPVSDITPLELLPELYVVYLSLSQVEDLAPLYNNPGMGTGDYLHVESCPLNQQSLCVYIPDLEDRGVDVRYTGSGECTSDAYTLTIAVDGQGAVEPAPGDYQYVEGHEISLTATPDTDWVFDQWLGPVADTTSPQTTLTMPAADTTVTAVFTAGLIADPALEDEIRDALRKPEGPLTKDDLERLYWLWANGAGISDLSGLEHCVNLRMLMLHNNNITDLEPLLELPNLRVVWLEGNPLSQEALCEQIPQLQEQGVRVRYSGGCIVEIPDWYLEFRIRAKLNIGDRDLYRRDLLRLITLDASHDAVDNLTGLEYCTNLRRLNLEYNRITDLSPLAGLTKLRYLNLEGNRISDVSPLAGLTNLHKLYLAKNDITDIAPLVANTGLGHGDTVDLADNPLTLTAICEQIPQLESRGVNVIADYHGDEVIDFPDDGLYLRIVLALPHITLGDDITLCDLEGLTRLDAASSEISELTGLEYCWDLEYLDLSDNNVTDLSPIMDLRKLSTLNLADNGIIHVDMLGDLSQLETLDLSYNLICSAVSDLAFLQQLENLEELYLGENNVYDLAPLSGLTNLRVLDLQANELHDIDTAPLSTLTSLENLNLSFNHVRSLDWLASLDSLQHLDLTHNQLRDVAPLGHCVGLNWLSLAENNVYDLSPLTSGSALGQGDRLDVRKNPLTPPSYADDIQALVERGVDVEYTQSYWCEEWNRGAGLWKSADADSVDPRCSCPDEVNVVVEPASGSPGAGQVMVFLGEPRWEIIGPTEGKIEEIVLRGTTVGVLAIANKGYGFDQWLTTPDTPVDGCEEPFVAFYAVNDTTHVEARFDSVGLSVVSRRKHIVPHRSE